MKPKVRHALMSSARMTRAIEQIAVVASDATRRLTEAERQRRDAIAATFDAWVETLDDAARRDVLVGLQLAATATHRRRIATHPACDEAVAVRVDEALAARAAADATAASELAANTTKAEAEAEPGPQFSDEKAERA